MPQSRLLGIAFLAAPVQQLCISRMQKKGLAAPPITQARLDTSLLRARSLLPHLFEQAGITPDGTNQFSRDHFLIQTIATSSCNCRGIAGWQIQGIKSSTVPHHLPNEQSPNPQTTAGLTPRGSVRTWSSSAWACGTCRWWTSAARWWA